MDVLNSFIADSRKHGRGPGVNKVISQMQKENQPAKENPQGNIELVTYMYCCEVVCYRKPPLSTSAGTKRRGRGLGVKTLAKQRLAQESQFTPIQGSSKIIGKLSLTLCPTQCLSLQLSFWDSYCCAIKSLWAYFIAHHIIWALFGFTGVIWLKIRGFIMVG